jgi:ribosome-binding factor A
MSHRIEQVNNLLRQEISELLRRQIKDPRLSSFLAVTEVITSPDLRHARVFVSRLGDETDRPETLKALGTASGFLRKELAHRLRLRRIPELNFCWDDSIEQGDRILKLINQVSEEAGTSPLED